jgi:hypothetical protein
VARFPDELSDELARALIDAPRALRKERGWSGAKIVGAVKLISERIADILEHGPTYEPREPKAECLAARQIISSYLEGCGDTLGADAIIRGQHDDLLGPAIEEVINLKNAEVLS